MALRRASIKFKELPKNITDVSFKRSMCTPPPVVKDVETHTGQKFAPGDYRLCRFELGEKQVNPNWAIKLIAEVPPKPVKGRVTWCDGGSGPTGHPRVYINLDKPGNHSCLYCGLRFYKEEDSH